MRSHDSIGQWREIGVSFGMKQVELRCTPRVSHVPMNKIYKFSQKSTISMFYQRFGEKYKQLQYQIYLTDSPYNIFP